LATQISLSFKIGGFRH